MPGRHPCERGRRCSCHRAGPSTPGPKKKTTTLVAAAAALVCPVLAAPTPPSARQTALPFLYPALEKRVTDAGQAPDDPSEGFTHEHIQLADLIRAGLPYKYVYDPAADPSAEQMEKDVRAKEEGGAWVIDNAWALHGRRFGPLYATATAGITDEPLPTPTESVPPASTPTPTTTTTPPPTILAIQSSLPTGWDSSQYERSDMYAIPLVVSFALVIALMIGSLIGAMVIRRDRSRSRRRKKRIIEQDDDSAREKVARSTFVSRVGRALQRRDREDEPDQEADENPRTELEQRVKTWARRSAAWRAQARFGVRRRMGRGRTRSQAERMHGPDTPMGGAIQEEPEPEDERNPTRVPTPVQSRAPSPIVTEHNEPGPPSAAPNYSSPLVPTYSSPPDAAGPSTPSPLGRMEAHPDASPSDEPAYDGPGAGDGLPPAYRGGGLSEVARGKRPAQSSESVHDEPRQEQAQEPRVWTELDAYAFSRDRQDGAVTAHVATDDKRVLERLHSMRGAPEEASLDGEVPREEDVFASEGSTPSGSCPTTTPPSSVSDGALSSLPVVPSLASGALPSPPTKTGTGPVARYGEADLSLPKYLDGEPGEGVSAGVGAVVPGVVEVSGGMVPSAPPCDEGAAPSALPCDGGMVPSAPTMEDASNQDSLPSAPPLDDHAPPDDHPMASAPPDDHCSPCAPPNAPSAPPLHDDTLHPDDPSLPPTPLSPHLQRYNSACPLLSEDR